MILGRCYVQTIRLAIQSDISKQYINSRGRGITFLECNVNSLSGRQISPALIYWNRKMASTSTDMGSASSKNKLALEKSPYLLQHATNPVDWYPWGEEALKKAKREDKLIFLSVGYSTCHWCHVMEKESFENPEIAKIMNRYFVNIKVDREERPDIDRVYMTFVQSITGHGGWPMSVFLTPDLIPITGGTYFPPVDKYGQPGFMRILESIAMKWIENKREFIESGSKVLSMLKQSALSKSRSEGDIPFDCVHTCVKQLISGYESRFGGFSTAPKFPQPVNLNFLFLMYSRDPKSEVGKECLNMCLHTLTKMANGGIHDHVGQGFARYSVDGKWHVPHFEKMLYDQGQLLRSYSDAYLATKDPFFSEIVDDIVTYVVRDLRHPEGAFYSAEDADSLPSHEAKEKQEGAFYVWRHEEIESLLHNDAINDEGLTLCDIFCHHFNVKPEGNVARQQDPHGELTGQNVLIVFGSIAETAEHFKLSLDTVKSHLQKGLEILFEERKKRPRPHLDDKIVTAWNGLMISGLSHAASALNNPQYIEHAVSTAKFIERYLFDRQNRILLRSCYRGENDKIAQTSTPINGFQVDYAFVIRGLLDLYEVSFDPHWLELAEQLQDIQDDLFWDSQSGGYYATKDDNSVILRLKDDQDGAEPSGNSVACSNLVRLAAYLDRAEFSDKAAKLLNSMRELLIKLPVACPELVAAFINLTDSTTQIYIVGDKASEDTQKLLRVVQDRLVPGRVIILADGECRESSVLYRKNEVIGKMKQQNGQATAYVCHHHVCSLPVTESDQLAELLDKRLLEALH